MTTLRVMGEVDQQHRLKLDVDCPLPPGPVDVVITTSPRQMDAPPWSELWGLGKEVWEGVDVNAYLAELREDREPLP